MLKSLLDEAVWIRAVYASLVAAVFVILPLPRVVALLLALLLMERILREAARAQNRPKGAVISLVAMGLSFPAASAATAFVILLAGIQGEGPLKPGANGQIVALVFIGFLSLLTALIQERPERAARGEAVREFGCNAVLIYLAICFLLTSFLTGITQKRNHLTPASGVSETVQKISPHSLQQVEVPVREPLEEGGGTGTVGDFDLNESGIRGSVADPSAEETIAPCREQILLFEAAHERYLTEPQLVVRDGDLLEILWRAGYLEKKPECPGHGTYELGFASGPGQEIHITLKCSLHSQ